MGPEDVQQIVAALRASSQPPLPVVNDASKNRVWIAVVIGLAVAVGGNFVGWFASKSTDDVANNTQINATLEFMKTQSSAHNTQIKSDLKELKEETKDRLKDIDDKLEAQFSRADFQREMEMRDNSAARLQDEIETLYHKIENSRNK